MGRRKRIPYYPPSSLEKAASQGLRVSHLLNIFRKHAAQPLSPTLLQALERWEKLGIQSQFQKPLLLRVASPEILAALRKTRAAHYLGEALNERTIIIKPGGKDAIQEALLSLGYLNEVPE